MVQARFERLKPRLSIAGLSRLPSPRVYVGLGDRDRVEKVTVTWLDGTQSTFGPYAANQIVKLEKLVESIE